ncbi:hypothetical protein CGZ80_21675 [Rhodopirellula sp. MGV]|nr:hypothetical protein CGZ80_21675 [Rhodopirellula sp. MGV]PNY34748.1 cytochrome C [Rhodopirellula baltica]
MFWNVHPALADDFANLLPRIKPTEVSEVMDTFQVADGYEIQLIASEPLINSPVAAEWSASGELYVCEMRGYSEDREAGLSRISRLTDVDQDGVYDEAIVFADGLLWPTAIFPYRDGLFVADAPNIWCLSDTNDDGVADQKRIVLTGFSTDNVQGLLNSFRWGLDHRIHVAVGTAGGKVRRPDQPESAAVSVRGFDLAFDPETFQFERTSGGAQHGMCFDDWGRKFVCSNSDHLQQVMYEDRYVSGTTSYAMPAARVSIADDGPQAEVFRISPVEPWRVLRTKLRVAGLVGGPVEGGGRAAGYFTGATGVTIYRGDAWTRDERGDPDEMIAIIGDVGSNLVHSKRLHRIQSSVANVTGTASPSGLPFVGSRIDQQREFVASTDNWFRPAQFACGPDGALTVIDVYREVIEHPKSLPPDIKRHLDLTAGRDRGRLYRVVPEGFRHRLTPNLQDADGETLVRLLSHPNAWHRETASRLIFERQDQSLVPSLRKMLGDNDPGRLKSLGRLHAMVALDGLSALAADDVRARLADSHPQVVRHAVRLAESFADNTEVVKSLAPLVKHASIDVRYQLAFSLAVFDIAERPEWLGKILMRNPSDRWMQAAIMSTVAVCDDKTAERLLLRLLDGLDDSELISDLMPVFDSLLAASTPDPTRESSQTIVEALVDAADDTAWLPLIEQVRNAGWVSAMDSVLAVKFDEKRQRLLLAASRRLGDRELPDDDRLAALQQLSRTPTRELELELLGIIEGDESLALTAAVLRAIGDDASLAVIETILARMKRWSPRLRAVACEVLFSNSAQTLVVFDAIDEGRCDVEEFPIAQWRILAERRDKSISRRAQEVVKQFQSKPRQSVIDQYQSELDDEGDVERGRAVFREQCAGCHQVGQLGHAVGPSLSSAATRGGESILVNVLDPNREVNPQYRNYIVLLSDGRTVAGMIAAENSASITLRAAEAVEQTVPRNEIEWIRDTGVSIMPEGLEKVITPEQMADLIAFLTAASR